MRVVIVYESLFGNTRQVAEAISDGVRESRPDAEIDCLTVEEANAERVGAADLLVVGGPTHMRGMTSGLTRKMGLQAEQKESEGDQEKPRHEPEEGAEGPGVRDWFHGLSKTRNGARAAAFDTRADFRLVSGAARHSAQAAQSRLPTDGRTRRLHHRGHRRPAAGRGTRPGQGLGRGTGLIHPARSVGRAEAGATLVTG